MKPKRDPLNKKIENYFRYPIIYSIFIIVIVSIIVIRSRYEAYGILIVILIVGIGNALLTYKAKKNLMIEVVDYAMNFCTSQKNFLYHFKLPYVILDAEGRIQWFNEQFAHMNPNVKLMHKPIHAIIPKLEAALFPSEQDPTIQDEVIINDRIYKVMIQHLILSESLVHELYTDKNRHDAGFVYALYLMDITHEVELEQKNEEQKPITGLLYIDNYEEAINSIEDVRRPLLVALIDRNINKFAKSIEGIVRKFEKDKYMLMFQKKYLEQLHKDRFSILDDIRNINIGNELPVTLSIGLGANPFSFTQSLDHARVAIDLALGRGGDQAVIKENDKFAFYGGKTRGIETSTRVKARIKAYAFRELIEESDRVLVMGHKLPDLDALGAAIGVYNCAKLFDKPAHIVLKDVTTSISTLYQRFVESGDYNDDLFIGHEEAIGYVNTNTLLVIVDVNRVSYVEYPELLEYVSKIVVFDHHRVTTDKIENPVLSYVEPYASSACEMVTEILRYISDKVKLRPLEADALFSGITLDTKNFVVKTGVKTFEAAAYLKRHGADVIRVRKLFRNDMASYKARATAVRDSEIYRDKMAITVCPSDIGNPILITAQTADELLNISGIKASFVLTNIEGTIYISARSFDDINVQLIMEKLGGGGHLSVAGAQLRDYTIEDAIQVIKKSIDEYIEEGE